MLFKKGRIRPGCLCLARMCLLGVIHSPVAVADNLLDSDIHALMAETTVNVASRTAESIVKAPAKVTVFTREDIENLGVTNLFDLLEYAPGFSILAKFHDVVAYADGLSTHSFMIYRDGILIRDPIEQRYHSNPPYIDLGNVERVEIMHGSGSVLYGQGAAAGVVQIISRRNENYASIGMGSHGRKRLVANVHSKQADSGLAANLSIQSQRDDGHAFKNLTSVWGYSVPTVLNQEGTDARKGPHEVELQVDFRNWTFSAGVSYAGGEGGIVQPTQGLALGNESAHQNRWLRLSREFEEKHGWSGKVALTQRKFDQSSLDLGFPGAFSGADANFIAFEHEREVSESKLEAHGQKKLNSNHSLQFGFEAQQVTLDRFHTLGLGDSEAPEPDSFLSVPNQELPEGLKTRQNHIYLQHKAQWAPRLFTNVGMRRMWHELTGAEDGAKSTAENSYRVAVNFQPDPQHNFKLIYNKSFDLFSVFHAVKNPYSFSEARSTELVYEFNNSMGVFTAGIDSKTYTQAREYALFDGSIDRQTEEFKTTQAEIGATVRLNTSTKLSLNASKPLSSKSNDEFSYFVRYQPSYTASAALTYNKSPYTANVSLTSRGGYDPSELRPGEVGKKTEVHANFRYMINKQATLVLSGRNLTDEILGWAEPVGVTGSLFFPSGRGREYYLGLEYQW